MKRYRFSIVLLALVAFLAAGYLVYLITYSGSFLPYVATLHDGVVTYNEGVAALTRGEEILIAAVVEVLVCAALVVVSVRDRLIHGQLRVHVRHGDE